MTLNKTVKMYLVSVERQDTEIGNYCRWCKELIEQDLHINELTFKGCLKKWCSYAAKEVPGGQADIAGTGYQIVFRRLGKKRDLKSVGRFSSRYKGVSFDERRKKWRAMITLEKKTKLIGFFQDEIAAAVAYNKRAMECRGRQPLPDIDSVMA